MNNSKISFCINTANNERPYIELLLQSLLNGIDINLHDILVFVDSDNQNTTELLVAQKSLFPNLKIIKNTGDPVGYAGNINYLFKYANTEIVSYLQSDMVVGLNYDKALLKHVTNNSILSSTRIEPPLHSPVSNAITYVQNFGLEPSEFNYEQFLLYCEEIKNPAKITNYFFAPFTCYKKLWNDIGGHDTSFKKSREDSDILYRFYLNNYDIIQCWDALVYHFTCTSSRCIGWWKKENQEREIIRQQNDQIELKRFIDKWGKFSHPTSHHEVQLDIQNNPKILDNIIAKNPPIDDTKFIFL